MPVPRFTRRPGPLVTLFVLATAVVVLGGCTASGTSGGNPTAGSPTAPAPGATSPPATAYPKDASALAAQVPECNGHPLRSSDSAAPGFSGVSGVFTTASSSAACSIRGATVVIFGFSDAHSQARNEAYLRQVDAYFAYGPGWTAAPEELGEPTGQQSLVQDVAISLGGRIANGRG